MIKIRKCDAEKCFQDCKYCLTRMMDCRKPTAGFIDNMKPDLLKDGMKARSLTCLEIMELIDKQNPTKPNTEISYDRLCSPAPATATPGSTSSVAAWTATAKHIAC